MARVMFLAALFAAGCSGSAGIPASSGSATAPQRATYPSSTNPRLVVFRCEGRTAPEWGAKALDGEFANCEKACRALGVFGSEGTPFLLNAAEEQAKQERYANLSVVLNAITGSYVHELDIERIAPFLDEKYAKLDNSNYPIRQRALKIFLSGHKKSAKMADRIRPLTKAANPQVAELAMKALKAIDVESEDRLSQ